MFANSLRLNIGICESSTWVDGALAIQPDAIGDGSVAAMLTMQPLGLYARPADPERDGDGEIVGAAACLYAHDGDETFAMPLGDPRGAGTHPEGPPGSVALYLPRSTKTSYVYLDGETGYQQLLVKYGDNDDKSLSISLDTSGDEPAIHIVHGEGHAIRMLNDGRTVLSNKSGAAYIEINDDGVVINGSLKINGAIMAGGSSGNNVQTTVDADAIKAAVQASLAGLISTSPGSAVTVSVPFVASTPGSSKLAAAL